MFDPLNGYPDGYGEPFYGIVSRNDDVFSMWCFDTQTHHMLLSDRDVIEVISSIRE